jgi:hypothetical protein
VIGSSNVAAPPAQELRAPIEKLEAMESMPEILERLAVARASKMVIDKVFEAMHVKSVANATFK